MPPRRGVMIGQRLCLGPERLRTALRQIEAAGPEQHPRRLSRHVFRDADQPHGAGLATGHSTGLGHAVAHPREVLSAAVGGIVCGGHDTSQASGLSNKRILIECILI